MNVEVLMLVKLGPLMTSRFKCTGSCQSADPLKSTGGLAKTVNHVCAKALVLMKLGPLMGSRCKCTGPFEKHCRPCERIMCAGPYADEAWTPNEPKIQTLKSRMHFSAFSISISIEMQI